MNKNTLLTYKLYLQTLMNIKEHGNQYKDEEVLPIFEENLKKVLGKNHDRKNRKNK